MQAFETPRVSPWHEIPSREITPEEVSAGVLTELADILDGSGHGIQDGLIAALRDGAAALHLDRIRTVGR